MSKIIFKNKNNICFSKLLNAQWADVRRAWRTTEISLTVEQLFHDCFSAFTTTFPSYWCGFVSGKKKPVPGATRPRTAFRSAVKGVWLRELAHHADNIVSTWECGWMLTLAFQIASNRLSWTSLTTSPIIPNLCLVLYLLLFSKKKSYIIHFGCWIWNCALVDNFKRYYCVYYCILLFFLCYSILLKEADFQITMFKHCWDLVCCRILV